MTNAEKLEYLERIHENSKNTIIQITDSKEFSDRNATTERLAKAYQKRDKAINLILKLDGRRSKMYNSAEYDHYYFSASLTVMTAILKDTAINITEDDD